MGDQPYPQLLRKAKERDARLALVAAADRFKRETLSSCRRGDGAFCELYNLGKLDAAPSARPIVTRLSVRSLRRWRAMVKADASERLGFDRGAARRGKAALATAKGGKVSSLIQALLADDPHFSAARVRQSVIAEFPEFQAPPLRTFQHFISGLKSTGVAQGATRGVGFDPGACV
jgi:hypothetical protein